MTESKRYKVIVSDRAKRMLGTHIRFMAQVNKEAAAAKKKEIMTAMRSLCQMLQRFPFLKNPILHRINITRCLLQSGILSSIKYKMIRCMWSIF